MRRVSSASSICATARTRSRSRCLDFPRCERDGIELSGAFVAVVNADLKVGTLQETIVVTGETPIVDVQSISRQTTMDNELINAIPAARSYGGLLTLMPNTVVQGGAASNAQVVPNMVVFGGAGGRSNEGRLQVDGLSVGTAFNGAGVSAYVVDVNNVQEVVLTASGGMGEAEIGGPMLNIRPEGRRQPDQWPALLARRSPKAWWAATTPTTSRARGLTTPGALHQRLRLQRRHRRSDHEGPRLVVPAGAQRRATRTRIPGMFANVDRGNATVVLRARSLASGLRAATFQTTALRLTSQLSAKHRVTGLWDEQKPCEGAAFDRGLRGLPSLRSEGRSSAPARRRRPACSRDGRAGNRRAARRRSAHAAGALDVAAHQPAAARGGLRAPT